MKTVPSINTKTRLPVFLGDLAYIPLSDDTDPEYTVIDRTDWSLVENYTFHKDAQGYATGWVRGEKRDERLHVIIIGDNYWDHANRDRLDNRRINLRPADQSQQEANKGLKSNNRSGYKGVHWRKDTKKWNAQITYQGKTYTLGSFSCKEEAARAYDAKAIELFGERAWLNFPGGN